MLLAPTPGVPLFYAGQLLLAFLGTAIEMPPPTTPPPRKSASLEGRWIFRHHKIQPHERVAFPESSSSPAIVSHTREAAASASRSRSPRGSDNYASAVIAKARAPSLALGALAAPGREPLG